jgi:hypothetical protein
LPQFKKWNAHGKGHFVIIHQTIKRGIKRVEQQEPKGVFFLYELPISMPTITIITIHATPSS